MAEPESPEAADAGRRRFVARATTGLGVLVGGALLAGPTGLILHPILKRGRQAPRDAWTPVAPASRFPVGAPPVRVVLSEDRQDAWLQRPDTPVGPVLVQRTAEAEFRVLSGICPHLGCSVNVPPAGASFACPCHRSTFALDGSLLPHPDGTPNPAPRGLDPLEWRLRGDRLEVRWVRYEPGREDRVPV